MNHKMADLQSGIGWYIEYGECQSDGATRGRFDDIHAVPVHLLQGEIRWHNHDPLGSLVYNSTVWTIRKFKKEG